MLLELEPAVTVQGGLFDTPDDPRSLTRMKAIDRLNARFGRETVTFAVSGRRRGWKLRSDFVSMRYTTVWGELLAV